MGKLIIKVLLVVLIAHLLAMAGLLGYGAVTNRLDQQKRAQYLATWRGETLVPPPPEEIVEEEEETPQQASSRILAAQIEREVFSREMQLYAQYLRDKEVTIDAAQAKLEKDISRLQTKRDEFVQLVEKQNIAAQNESFGKALKNYSNMKAKYVKDDFMKMDEEDVVRYLSEMKSGTATAILERFKSPEEQAKRLALMKKLEKYGIIDADGKENDKNNAGNNLAGIN